jgi:2C-methyl-D-erythritol 2,4-cyclodiphosphate synthase
VTSGTVRLTIGASDTIALHATAYSFDNGATWQAESTGDFIANQTVNIKVRDTAYNITSSSYTINNIDTTAPSIYSIKGDPTSPTSGTVTLTIDASDDAPHTVAYSFDDGATWQAEKTKDFTENQTVLVQVRDEVNNISSSDYTIDNIDTTAPVIVSVLGDPTSPTSGTVSLTITATDNVALHATAYSFDNGATWQAGNTKDYDENQPVFVQVRDAVNNISSSGYTIDNIDTLAPTCEIEYSTKAPTNQPVIVSLT